MILTTAKQTHPHRRGFTVNLMLLLTTLLVLAISSCKPFRGGSTGLKTGGNCVFRQDIRTLEIHVRVDGDIKKGNVFYNYQFSDNFYIPHWGNMNREVDTGIYSDREMGDILTVGETIPTGLKVGETFKYLKADFRTECLSQSQLDSQYPASTWPQNPSFIVEVNGQHIFSALTTSTTTTVPCLQSEQFYRSVTIDVPPGDFTNNVAYKQAARCAS